MASSTSTFNDYSNFILKICPSIFCFVYMLFCLVASSTSMLQWLFKLHFKICPSIFCFCSLFFCPFLCFVYVLFLMLFSCCMSSLSLYFLPCTSCCCVLFYTIILKCKLFWNKWVSICTYILKHSCENATFLHLHITTLIFLLHYASF